MVSFAMHTIRVRSATIELLPRAAYEARYTPDVPVIGFAFETQAGVHAFASSRSTGFRTRANSLAYLPPGCDVFSRSESGGEYLTVRGAWLGVAPDKPCERRFNDVVEVTAMAAAQALRRLVLSRVTDPSAYVDGVLALSQAVEDVLDERRPPVSAAAAGMTAARLRRIDDIIEDRLEGGLTVFDLADELGLSVGYFSRAFRAAMGMSPHAYIVDRRLSRARLYLRAGRRDLAQIAAACGFSSHAHMSTLFRRRFGVAPSALR
jgi:AraC family transcriptional regulator